MTPMVLRDVDGVLNPSRRSSLAWRRYTGIVDGEPYKILLIQAQHMGLLSPAHVNELRGPTGAQLARRYGWARQYEREQETAHTRRPPRRVLERATTAYRTGRLSIRTLAALEGRDPADLENGLADAGITPRLTPARHADVGRLLTRARATPEET